MINKSQINKIYYISNYLSISQVSNFKLDLQEIFLYTFDQILQLPNLNNIINCNDNIYIYIENIDKETSEKIFEEHLINLIDNKNN